MNVEHLGVLRNIIRDGVPAVASAPTEFVAASHCLSQGTNTLNGALELAVSHYLCEKWNAFLGGEKHTEGYLPRQS